MYKGKYNKKLIKSGCNLLKIWNFSEDIVRDVLNKFERQLNISNFNGMKWNPNMDSKLIFNCSCRNKNEGRRKIYIRPVGVNETDDDEEYILDGYILDEAVRKLKEIFVDCKVNYDHKEVTDAFMDTTIHSLIIIDWS